MVLILEFVVDECEFVWCIVFFMMVWVVVYFKKELDEYIFVFFLFIECYVIDLWNFVRKVVNWVLC